MGMALYEREQLSRQLVTITIGGEVYAVDAVNVREIVELTSVTRVPRLPEFFRGVINLRGHIIPVLDLKLRFGIPSEEYGKHTCIVVVEFSGGIMGLIVDGVSDVTSLAEEEMAEAPVFGRNVDARFIAGLGKSEGRLLIILDLDQILSEDEAGLLERTDFNEISPAAEKEK